MRGIGRLFQVVGWLLIIGAIVASFLDIARINILPGILFLIFGRIFRAAGRRQAPEEAEPGDESTKPRPTVHTPPPPADDLARQTTEPRPRPEPKPAAAERPEILERIAKAGREAAEEGDELLERVAGAGREAAERRPRYPPATPKTNEGERPLSSDEMIAQARKRWDRPER